MKYRHSYNNISVRKTVSAVMAVFAIFAATSLTSCVKDDLFNTPHPDHGKITVTTDWSNRGEGIAVPDAYTVSIGDYTAQASGTVHEADYLFDPGNYRLAVYNAAEHISVSGTTATVGTASGNWDGVGNFIEALPGWQFTSVQDITIEKDTDYSLTAAMHQQVRQLTFIIEPTGDASPRIESIEGYLSGAASTLDFATDTYGGASNVEVLFTKITEGADAGKWTASVRMLGIAGAQQKLAARLRFTDGNPTAITFDSDLTTALADFNSGKATAVTLSGTLVETPTEAGFSATITDWQAGNGNGEDVEIH